MREDGARRCLEILHIVERRVVRQGHWQVKSGVGGQDRGRGIDTDE